MNTYGNFVWYSIKISRDLTESSRYLKGLSNFFYLSKWKFTRTRLGTIFSYFLLMRLSPISIEGGSLLSLGVMTLMLLIIVWRWSNFIPRIAAENFREKKMSALVLRVSIIYLTFSSLNFGSSRISTFTLWWSYPTTFPFFPHMFLSWWVTSTSSPNKNSSWRLLKLCVLLVVI